MKTLVLALMLIMLITLTVLPTSLGCGGGNEVIIPATTKVLSEESLGYISSVTEDLSVITFADPTVELKSLTEGDVIVSDVSDATPYGLLRKVTGVTLKGDELVVETTSATLEEAIQKAKIEVDWSLGSQEGAPNAFLPFAGVACAEDDSLFPIVIDTVLYDLDGNNDTTDDQIKATGSLDLEADFDFLLDIDDHKVKELELTITITETAEMNISGDISLVDIHPEPVVLLSQKLPTVTIWAGWVPIVIVPKLSVHVGFDGEVTASISAGVTQEAKAKAGLRYKNGDWSPIKELSNTFDWVSPSLDVKCQVKAYAGPVLSFLLYGISGPYGDVDGYLELEADPFKTPWWQLYGGINADIGIKVEVLGDEIADYELPGVIDYRKLLAEAAGEHGESAVPTHSATPECGWTFGGDNNAVGYGLIETADGGYLIAGRIEFISVDGLSNTDVYLMKIDTSGKEEWHQTIGGSYQDIVEPFPFSNNAEGGYYLYMKTIYNEKDGTYYKITLDDKGREKSRIEIDQSEYLGRIPKYSYDLNMKDWPEGVLYSGVPTMDSGFIIGGTTIGTRSELDGDACLKKFDNYGSEIWTQTYDLGKHEDIWALQQTIDGGYIITGITGHKYFKDGHLYTYDKTTDIFLIKVDENGGEKWRKTFGGQSSDYSLGIIQAGDGGYIVAGHTYSYGSESDIYVIKTDKEGNCLSWR